MKKFNRFAAAAMSAVMAASLLAGCSKSAEESQAVTTAAEGSQAEETKAEEGGAEETEAPSSALVSSAWLPSAAETKAFTGLSATEAICPTGTAWQKAQTEQLRIMQTEPMSM